MSQKGQRWEWSIGRECYERRARGEDLEAIRRDLRLPTRARVGKYLQEYRKRHGLPALKELGVKTVMHDRLGHRIALDYTMELFPWEEEW